MKTNDLYNQMLSAYELATEQQRRNAVFEINQQIILAGLYSGGFLTKLLSMEEHVFVFFMVCRDSQKIWTFVRNPKELDIWSNDYFLQLAKMIQFG